MRFWLVIFSVVVHGGLFALALQSGSRPEKRRATALSMAEPDQKDKKKEKPPEKKPDPPPPPPRAKASHADPPAPAAPQPLPAEPKPTTRAAAPVAGEQSNGGGGPLGSDKGDGPAVGGGGGTGAGKKAAAATPTRAKAPDPSGASEDKPCSEAPTKPAPANRSREIEYTQDARANGIEGRLVLKIIVGADGSVTDVIVVNSVDPALDAAAIAAVKSWAFRPSTRCGTPMAGGIYMLAQRFELGD